ncbi:glucosaminidase domain-containing protein [Paenibacillus algorifonticola]|uniref:glycoside hydrolase family 73 protein n=1 Tax=Paenibacillus algorifonticola TaxID=684063 RepID=UPI003D2D85E8
MTQYSRAAFIETLAPHVLRARREGSPMLPSVRLAQNILETGCKIHDWNNLGGIKVGKGKPNAYWRGKAVNKGTWEEYNGKTVNITAAFRAYDTVYDFYMDQDLLFGRSRYARVRAAQTPEEQAAALYACGYATDSAYASKLLSIIKANDLKKYDAVEADAHAEANEHAHEHVEAVADEQEMKLSEAQKKMLVAALQSLFDQKVITDKTWIEKAQKGTLTLWELTWLNTIILARK